MARPAHPTPLRPRPADPRPGLSARVIRRATRRALGVMAALTTGMGVVVFVAPAASASGPVPYAVDFDSPAIPPGGPNRSYLNCPADVGATVPVAVKDPNGVVVAHSVVADGPQATPAVD